MFGVRKARKLRRFFLQNGLRVAMDASHIEQHLNDLVSLGGLSEEHMKEVAKIRRALKFLRESAAIIFEESNKY